MKISKKHTGLLLIASLVVLSGCEDKGTTTVKEIKQETTKPAVEAKTYEKGEIDTHGAKDAADQIAKVEKTQKTQSKMPHPMPPSAPKGTPHTAVAVEILQAPPYVYGKVKEGDKEYWMAAPSAKVAVGDEISFSEQMWMQNFTSKTLNRTFDKVMFASSLVTKAPATKAQEKKVQKDEKPASEEKEEIKENSEPKESAQKEEKIIQPTIINVAEEYNESTSAANKEAPAQTSVKIFSVEQIYAQADDLNNSTVSVKGKVVKVSEDIMGRNWIHIQDGTGSKGTDDLVFTSPTDSAVVGDEITATGTLKTNIDFGYGYSYSVIIENSKFVK